MPKTDSNSPENNLWLRFLTGDEGAYTEIYNTYIEDMFSYGMHFTSDRELLKDCLHDVFVKIYSNRSSLKQTDNIRLYLYTALKNTLFNVFQKDKHSYHIDTVEPVFATEYSTEKRMIADEQEQEVRENMNVLLSALTPRQREVIHYRYVEGLKMEEICRIMEMNYQSVQNLIQRSIKKIKSSFPEKKESVLSIKFISRCL